MHCFFHFLKLFIFEQRTLHFYFALRFTNHIATACRTHKLKSTQSFKSCIEFYLICCPIQSKVFWASFATSHQVLGYKKIPWLIATLVGSCKPLAFSLCISLGRVFKTRQEIPGLQYVTHFYMINCTNWPITWSVITNSGTQFSYITVKNALDISYSLILRHKLMVREPSHFAQKTVWGKKLDSYFMALLLYKQIVMTVSLSSIKQDTKGYLPGDFWK